MSSDSEDQLNSFSVQMEHYTGLIKDNAEWNFAGIYADEGITGTAADKRESFQRLLKTAGRENRPDIGEVHFAVCAQFSGYNFGN